MRLGLEGFVRVYIRRDGLEGAVRRTKIPPVSGIVLAVFSEL